MVWLLVLLLFTLVPFAVGLAVRRTWLAVGLAAVGAVVATVSQASDDHDAWFAPGVALLGAVGVLAAWGGANLRRRPHGPEAER